jgi:hypothetical protein
LNPAACAPWARPFVELAQNEASKLVAECGAESSPSLMAFAEDAACAVAMHRAFLAIALATDVDAKTKHRSPMIEGYCSKQSVQAGTELKVTIHVDDHYLTLKGQVKHTEPQVGLGIEFREIRKGERQILQFLIRKLAD